MKINDILKADSVAWFDQLDVSLDGEFSALLDNKFYRPVELESIKGTSSGFIQYENGREDPEHCFGCFLSEEKGTNRKSWFFVEGNQDLINTVILPSKEDLQQFKAVTNAFCFLGLSYRRHASLLGKVINVLHQIKENPFTNDPTKAARVVGRMLRYAHERVAYLKQCLKSGYRPKIEVGMISRVKGALQSSKCIRIIEQAGELENHSSSLLGWLERFKKLEGMTNPNFYKQVPMNPYSIRTRPGLSIILKNRIDFLSTIEYDEDQQSVRFCLYNDFSDFAAAVVTQLPGQATALTRKQITVKSDPAVCCFVFPSIIQWLEKIAAHPCVDDPRKAAEFARRALLFVARTMQGMLADQQFWDEYFSVLVAETRKLPRLMRIEPKNLREMRWTLSNQSLLYRTQLGLFLVEKSLTEAKPLIPENPLEARPERKADANKQITALKQKLAAAKNAVRENNKEVARLNATIQGKNEQIEESEKIRRKLAQELEHLQVKTADKTEKYEQLKSEVDGVLQENLVLVENKERQSDVIDAQCKRIAELEATIEVLLGKGNVNEELKIQLADALKLKKALESATSELGKIRAEKELAEETIRKLSQSYGELRQKVAAGRSQIDTQQKIVGAQEDVGRGSVDRLLRPLIFGESMSATDALKLIETIFPDRVKMLDSVWESAAEIKSSFSQGKELTKTLYLLATDYLDAYLEAGDVKARTVFGTKYSSQESERVQQDPKFARERTFGGVLMQQHLRIGYSERLYFKVDVAARKVVIGYCGAHLPIVSR